MSDHKHTPSRERWKYLPGPGSIYNDSGEHHHRIADVRGWGYLTGGGAQALGMSEEEAKRAQDSWGRLIAAAPALRDALAELVRLLEPLEETGRLGLPGVATLNRYRRVLALADGQEEA